MNNPIKLIKLLPPSQKMGNPTPATTSAASRSDVLAYRRVNLAPNNRPATIAAKNTLIAVAAELFFSPTSVVKKSAPQYPMHHSTADAKKSVAANHQNATGSFSLPVVLRTASTRSGTSTPRNNNPSTRSAGAA